MFTAYENEDFIPVSYDIIFNSNTTSTHRVYIPLLNDDCVELDEYFSVALTTSLNCVNLVNDTVNITITEDDCKPLFKQLCIRT